MKIHAHPDHTSGLVVTHPYIGTTDAAGKFRIDGLPEAMYTISSGWAADVPEWVMPNRENVLVKSGATVAEVKLQLERSALVVGEITDSQTGKGLKGASVAALNPARSGATGIGSSVTDDEGRYVLRLPIGASKLYLSSVPDGYDYPRDDQDERIVTIAAGEANKELPPIVLSRPSKVPEPPGIATLRGRVVDAAGKPMQGIAIADDRIENWPSGEMPVQDPKAAITDAEGKFAFKAGAGIKHRLLVSDWKWQHDATKQFTPKKDETFTHAGHRHPRAADRRDDHRRRRRSGRQAGRRRGSRLSLAAAHGCERKIQHGSPRRREAGPDQLAQDRLHDAELERRPAGREGRPFRPPAEPSPGVRRGPPAAADAEAVDREGGAEVRCGKVDSSGGCEAAEPAQGRKMFVVFDWNCDDPAAVKKTMKQLEGEAAKANADAVLIFGPQSHEAGVRAMLGDEKPKVSIGIDRFVVDSEYDISGATMIAWGFGRMPHAFVVDEKGVVRHEQRGVAKLADCREEYPTGVTSRLGYLS